MYFWCGSSPRVRGTVRLRPVRHGERRFIPACAGNRNANNRWEGQVSVHPRVCGEQVRSRAVRKSPAGSSPRVRGTVDGYRGVLRMARFIPACAGNSPHDQHFEIGAPVHPRVCGEQGTSDTATDTFDGSSPRVRGTALRHMKDRPTSRFIPACAGNRTPRTTGRWRSTVHPRVCGEQAAVRHVDNLVVGSSPRVRGTGAESPRAMGDSRFIPACAGNSHGHADPRC